MVKPNNQSWNCMWMCLWKIHYGVLLQLLLLCTTLTNNAEISILNNDTVSNHKEDFFLLGIQKIPGIHFKEHFVIHRRCSSVGDIPHGQYLGLNHNDSTAEFIQKNNKSHLIFTNKALWINIYEIICMKHIIV